MPVAPGISRIKNPIKIAREIVDLNMGQSKRSIAGVRAPRYLTGDKTSLQDIESAKMKTLEAFNRGALTSDEFKRESEIIKELEDLIREMGSTEGVDEDTARRLKLSEKAGKR